MIGLKIIIDMNAVKFIPELHVFSKSVDFKNQDTSPWAPCSMVYPTHPRVHLYPFAPDKLLHFYRRLNRDMRFDADISTSIYIPNDVYSLWSFLNHMSSLLCDGSLEGSNVINTDLRYMSFYLNCSIEMIHVFSKY